MYWSVRSSQSPTGIGVMPISSASMQFGSTQKLYI